MKEKRKNILLCTRLISLVSVKCCLKYFTYKFASNWLLGTSLKSLRRQLILSIKMTASLLFAIRSSLAALLMFVTAQQSGKPKQCNLFNYLIGYHSHNLCYIDLYDILIPCLLFQRLLGGANSLPNQQSW